MRFADVDQFGHVNNTVQQAYFDLGKTDFFVQLHYGDELHVETQMVEIGNKSFRLRQSILRGEEVCSRSEGVMVCFDATTKQATEVPDAWREYLTEE